MKRYGHECPGRDCQRCEELAEDRAEQRAGKWSSEEPLDKWGRDADWNWPRGYGGGQAVGW